MELEYWDKNPFKAIAKAFPSRFHFKPTAINKTRIFYEFILKVLQPPNLHEIKKIVPFDPRGYTYWDYIDA